MRWVPIKELVITSSVNSVHCDTRDFYCASSDSVSNGNDDVPVILRMYSNSEEFLINQDEIFSVLSNIANISGGLDCTWRFLEFPLVENAGKNKTWECKYFRLYRVNNSKFIFCNAHNQPIDWKLLTKENLIEEDLLCAH